MTVWRSIAALVAFSVALLLAPHLQRHAATDELPGAMQAKHLDPSGPIEEFAFIVVLTSAGAAIPLAIPALRLTTTENRRARRPPPHEAILVAALLPSTSRSSICSSSILDGSLQSQLS